MPLQKSIVKKHALLTATYGHTVYLSDHKHYVQNHNTKFIFKAYCFQILCDGFYMNKSNVVQN